MGLGIFDLIVGPVADVVKDVIDKQVIDKNAAANAKMEVDKALTLAAIQQAQAQTDINKAEASNPNIFVAGWRPFVGWTCGVSMASTYIIGPFFTWGTALFNHPTPYPVLDLSQMMPLLVGMLGFGYMRTLDKKNGTA